MPPYLGIDVGHVLTRIVLDPSLAAPTLNQPLKHEVLDPQTAASSSMHNGSHGAPSSVSVNMDDMFHTETGLDDADDEDDGDGTSRPLFTTNQIRSK